MCGADNDMLSPRCASCGEELLSIKPAGDGQQVFVGPAEWTNGTVVSRHIAAVVDNTFALMFCFMAATAIPGDRPLLQTPLLVGSYFAYFLLFEALLSRTPGKFLTGLVVVQFDGTRCTWRQVLIRTGLRLAEVNPLFFGGLPAAVQVVWTKYRQRLGDRLAGTLVVAKELLPTSDT